MIIVQIGAMEDARSKEHQGDTRYVNDYLKVIYHYILSSHVIIAVQCSLDQLSTVQCSTTQRMRLSMLAQANSLSYQERGMSMRIPLTCISQCRMYVDGFK